MNGQHFLRSMRLLAGALPLLLLGSGKTPPEDALLSKEPPVWRVDLRSFGYAERKFRGCIVCTRMTFTDEHTLAVTFVTSEVSPVGPRPYGPVTFRTLYLEARTGQLRAARDWSSPSYDFELLSTHDGKFIVRVGDQVTLYSPTFEELHHQSLTLRGESNRPREVQVSWNGRWLLLEYFADQQLELDLVDADTFQQIHSWTMRTPVVWSSSATDDVVAVNVGFHPPHLEIAQAGQSWRPLYRPVNRSCRHEESAEPTFVDNRIVVALNCSQLAGIQTEGEVLFTKQFDSRREEPLSVVTSQDGRRFGVLVYKWVRAVSWFEYVFDPISDEVPERVIVYNVPNGQSLYARNVRGDLRHDQGQIRLSPRGSLLAVFSGALAGHSDGVAEVYRLPGAESTNQKPAAF